MGGGEKEKEIKVMIWNEGSGDAQSELGIRLSWIMHL